MANDTERGARGPAAELAVRHLRTLKPEHQELLAVLMADPGMGAGTLEVLVEHLFEEEDPRLVTALHRARAGGGEPAIAASVRSGATVGSLRAESAPSARSASVGSLRAR
jgi:hypothetical protein